MKDPAFIQQMISRAKQASTILKESIPVLTVEQLNYKSSPDSWSIGQCLDHLVVSDSLYFPLFEKVSSAKHKMSRWERWNPLNGFFGKMLVSQVKEIPARKMNAPKIFKPSQSNIDPGIFDRFHTHLNTLANHIWKCSNLDIDKMNITSPVSSIITYSLRDAITLLVQHEHRHVNQALKLFSSKEFPV